MDLYSATTSMEFHVFKEVISFFGLNVEVERQILQIFPFISIHFNEGFKYLGFPLKPNGYGRKDWEWLIYKIEVRINNWCN